MSEIQAMQQLMGMGSTCATCGFRYWEHKGHLIPCPVCELAKREPATDVVRNQALEEGDKLMQAKLSGFNEGLEEAAKACDDLAQRAKKTWDEYVERCRL